MYDIKIEEHLIQIEFGLSLSVLKFFPMFSQKHGAIVKEQSDLNE